MKDLLIVKGSANRGKTSSLNCLIQKLLETGWNICFSRPEKEHWDTNPDKFVVLERGKFKIACITYGDPGCEESMEDALETCIELNVDVIISASRTKGCIYTDILLEFAKKHNLKLSETTNLYGHNLNEDDKSAFNNIFAKELFDWIEYVLYGTIMPIDNREYVFIGEIAKKLYRQNIKISYSSLIQIMADNGLRKYGSERAVASAISATYRAWNDAYSGDKNAYPCVAIAETFVDRNGVPAWMNY